MTFSAPALPVALTMGDPCGIGPELTVKAWRNLSTSETCFVWLGDPDLLAGTVPFQIVDTPSEASAIFRTHLPVMPVPLGGQPDPGQANRRWAPAVISSIKRATELVLAGQASSIVTNPISKHILQSDDFRFPGHTEYLAHLCGVDGSEVMMLVSPELRVVPVTIHVSLKNALAQLGAARIVAVGQTLATALRQDFGIERPRIAVAGLNPHAGEAGYLGDEETLFIAPAVDILRSVCGDAEFSDPMPPDTMFTPLARRSYDAALCMYHDQALIPLKTLDMTHGVNVSLGLPIIRTSPDHGTAFNIAGQGVADPTSLLEAIHLAWQLSAQRQRAERKRI